MADATMRENHIAREIKTILQQRGGLRVEFIAAAQPPFAGLLSISGEWGEVSRPVIFAWRITPQQGRLLLFQLEALAQHEPLLLADYISENLAAQLREHAIAYFDCVGNGSLWAAPFFYEVSGRKRKAARLLPNRSQQAAGAKIIFQLLKQPHLAAATYRDIAAAANVALGAIGAVLKELRGQHLLLGSGAGGCIGDMTALRQLWERAYLGRLRPGLHIERCSLSSPWRLEELPTLIREQHLEDEVLLGGKLAASFYCENVVADSAVLHMARKGALKQMLRLRLVPDAAGPITVIERFAANDVFEQRSPENLQLADPRLVRAELLFADDEQQVELAETIARLYLAGYEQQYCAVAPEE